LTNAAIEKFFHLTKEERSIAAEQHYSGSGENEVAAMGDSLFQLLVTQILHAYLPSGSVLSLAAQEFVRNENVARFMRELLAPPTSATGQVVPNPHRLADLFEACLYVTAFGCDVLENGDVRIKYQFDSERMARARQCVLAVVEFARAGLICRNPHAGTKDEAGNLERRVAALLSATAVARDSVGSDGETSRDSSAALSAAGDVELVRECQFHEWPTPVRPATPLEVEAARQHHPRAAVRVAYYTRKGTQWCTPAFYPCCGQPEAAAPTTCAAHDCKRDHTGSIEAPRRTKNQALKASSLAHWTCCEKPLVEPAPAPQQFRVIPACESGCVCGGAGDGTGIAGQAASPLAVRIDPDQI
jgi:hypothetical protein